jgi:hypothetical protein
MATHSQTSLDQDLRTGVWYCHGATVFTLKEEPGRYHNGQPLLVNDHSFLVQGPNAEAVAAQVHSALTAPPRPDHAGGVADVGVSGPINGMGEPDLSGSYMRLSVSAHGFTRWHKISIGAAEVLAAELAGLLDTPAQAPDKAAEREGVDLRQRITNVLVAYVQNTQMPGHYHGRVMDAIDWSRRDEIVSALTAVLTPKPTGTEAGRGVGAENEALRYAESLCRALYEKHWTVDAPEWQPLAGDLIGLLSQIDNMTAGLTRAATPTPPTPDSTGQGDGTSQEGGLTWAVSKWQSEVANRPLQNVHRRSLDTTWRQVIRYFGGDPDALVGPSHDDLVGTPPVPADREGGR